MIKKVISVFAAVLLTASLLPAQIFADSAKTVEVQNVRFLDSDENLILGKINRGDNFYFSAALENKGTQSVDVNAYLAVYSINSDKIYAVFKSGDIILEAGGSDDVLISGSIPENIDDSYFIKTFIFEKSTLYPLCSAISFNASGAYETESVDGGYLGKDIIIDPSFENDNLVTNGWNARGAADIVRSSDYVLDKNYSCKVYDRRWDSDSIKQDIIENLKKSGSGNYRVRYNVLTAQDGENFQLIFRMFDKEGNKISAKLNKYDDLYVKKISANEWAGVDKTVSITVPKNIYSAEMYIETMASTSAPPDFYIDLCSVRKIISYDEYLSQNAVFTQSDPAYELQRLIEKSGDDSVTVRPKQSGEILKNPYKGLNYYTTKLDFSNLNLEGEGAKISNVVYARYSWAALEPEDGVYKFDIIENNINLLKSKNMMLGIGIGATIKYNNSKDYDQNTPEWLFEKYGAKYYELKIGTDSIKIPYYNNTVFLEKMQRFLDAFSKRFNGNENIAYVDMRVYGNWGEWHFYSSVFDEYNSLTNYTKEDLHKLVDMFKDFKLPLAMFTSNTDSLNYAADTLNTGVRVDGTLNPDGRGEHLKLKGFDGKNFAVAEWFMQPESFYPAGTYNGKTYKEGKYSQYFGYLPTYIEKVIREGAVSYISLGYWNPEDFYNMFPDLSRRIANKTGYWFKPIKITYPEKLTDGLFAMTVKNDGSAKLYAGYKNNSGLKLALANENGEITEKINLNSNPKDWCAGEISYICENFSFSNTTGAARLYLGVFSDMDDENPDIKLGIDAECVNGWYDLTNIQNAENVSDNRLYYTSLPYAEDGYGYRDLDYAFDGSDETYFASEIREGEYFEVDFGEYVKVSDIIINAKEQANAKISVYGISNGKSQKIAELNGINAGENKISADTSACKIRFVFDQTSLGGVIKINSIKMN